MWPISRPWHSTDGIAQKTMETDIYKQHKITSHFCENILSLNIQSSYRCYSIYLLLHWLLSDPYFLQVHIIPREVKEGVKKCRIEDEKLQVLNFTLLSNPKMIIGNSLPFYKLYFLMYKMHTTELSDLPRNFFRTKVCGSVSLLI